MASNQTEHLGLNLWEGTDHFQRTEFNQDNRKISQAIWERNVAHTQLSEALRTVGYYTYQLLLRAYYEGNEIFHHRGILFDGFLNDSKIESKNPVLFCANRSVTLYQDAEADWSTPHGGSRNDVSRYSLSTAARTAIGAGEITSFQLYYSSELPSAGRNYILDVVVNGTVVQSATFRLSGSTTTLTTTVTFEHPIPVIPGDQYSFVLSKDKNGASSAFYFGLASGSESQLAGAVHVTGRGAQTGAMTVKALEMQPNRRGTLYVRYSEGAVLPRWGENPLEWEESRQTVSADGAPCTEDRWAVVLEPGDVAPMFQLTCGESGKCVFHDYGLLLF